MKITTVEQTESISDIVCDVCGSSTRIEGHGLQFGTLNASWGYGSSHDGERYEVHLCEPCFFRTLSALKREHMVNFMFSDEGQDLSEFGRIVRDGSFNDDGGATP
ncbi:hypothetical protein DFO61_0399 [Ectopseudomonas oleovorans]|uniref:Uncharacterized protein n=1 Tax=Ectopseudomonas oleovorans TaxID=301 RepID=A0A397NMJ6_ECTOL|nr:hypothetical protein [Pseudomonas oleovorans]RIA35945.1 hypothetical protein DFO61_0399 [Pseudomonas oleovorans]